MGYRANPLDYIDYFTVRMDARSVPTIIAALRVIGERFDPDHPFEFNFLDTRLADFYTSERQVRSVIGAAALLAILIACMGLFGLAAFMAERRTKEIGIRKVLGATVGQIVRLLTGEFAWLVGIAFVVASPLAYLAIRWWLQDFAYRAPVGLSVFLLAGGASLLLAVLTVSYQAIRAALADPVESLRYE
jgi:putative ABC transport system permease protein